MYIPPSFAVTDPARLHGFVAANPFGLLVSNVEGVPFATHLPFLLDRDAGPHGQLLGHMARANPHWHTLDGREVLAVFSGPHGYVSPAWYEAENVVPTWNYVAVHAYGTCRLIDDSAALAAILTASVATFEGPVPYPWKLDTAGEFFARLVKGIVGFRIEVSRLEGKWKLSQNQPAERRAKVERALAASADPAAQEVARMMAEEAT